MKTKFITTGSTARKKWQWIRVILKGKHYEYCKTIHNFSQFIEK